MKRILTNFYIETSKLVRDARVAAHEKFPSLLGEYKCPYGCAHTPNAETLSSLTEWEQNPHSGTVYTLEELKKKYGGGTNE